MSPKKQTYKQLLEKDSALRRWHSEMSQGAEVTANVNIRRLLAFIRTTGIDHNDLLTKDPKELYNIMCDYRDQQLAEGYAGSYIESTLKAVRSWLFTGDIQVKKIKVKGATDRPNVDNEINPTQPELRRIFLSATMRDRVSCVLMAHSGVRPQVLGDYHGADGLRVSDFPELVIEGKTVSFQAVPTLIKVRPKLSKAGHQYLTFLSDEGCEYLKEYLEYRMAQGEVLGPNSDIIHAKSHNKQFITAINVGDGIRNAIRKAGFTQRPYVLRSFFDTQLMVAESQGKLPNQYRDFFMGHTGNMSARYTTNKRRLPAEVIEDMRQAYARAQVHLQTTNPGPTEDQATLTLRKQMLMLAGFTTDQLEGMDLGQKTDEEIQTIFKDKITAVMVNNGNSQRVIPEAKLEKFLADGWVYVDKLSGGKVIVKLPK